MNTSEKRGDPAVVVNFFLSLRESVRRSALLAVAGNLQTVIIAGRWWDDLGFACIGLAAARGVVKKHVCRTCSAYVASVLAVSQSEVAAMIWNWDNISDDQRFQVRQQLHQHLIDEGIIRPENRGSSNEDNRGSSNEDSRGSSSMHARPEAVCELACA